MKISPWVTAFLFWSAVCIGNDRSASQIPGNLKFEVGRSGETPPVWFVPTQGWAAEISTENCKEGKSCARLAPNEDSRTAQFGNLMQSIDAMPYRNKVIRLRAAIRTQNAAGGRGSQMWLRVDRPNQKMGFFENMDDRPIIGTDWAHYDITGPVAKDALSLNFGVMVMGVTIAWIDDVSIEVVGEAKTVVAPVEPARPLTDRGLENLTTFARLFGYVRFFHPSDEAAAADWDRTAIEGVRAVESAQSANELAQKLENFFRPLAPTLRAFPSGNKAPALEELRDPADKGNASVVAWEHRGVGLGRANQVYSSRRVFTKLDPSIIDRPKPSEPLSLDLGGGVSCSLPLALYATDGATIPKTTPLKPNDSNNNATSYSGDDRTTRLADIILCWTIMEHFYPYFDVVPADWSGELKKALSAAASDADAQAFSKTFQRMIAGLHDGHGNVWHSESNSWARLPFEWDLVEDKLVLTAIAPAAPGELRAGDIVRRIDGGPAAGALKNAESLVSGATPQWRRHIALGKLRTGAAGERVELEIAHADGSIRSTVFTFDPTAALLSERRVEKIAEVRPGIYYVDIDRINDDDFRSALPKLEQAKGIVFDFRGYPSNLSAWVFFPHIIRESVVSPQWHVPTIRRPDRSTWEWPRGGEWNIAPQEPYLKAKKAFLINGRAISYAESCLGIIENYKLGELVGGPTAGTNGNINPFELPGGYNVVWTGMKVLKHDGSRHHGVGILPTVPVSRTIRGVSEGKDELLERAIEIVAK